MDWNALQQETVMTLLAENTLKELQAKYTEVGLLLQILQMSTPGSDEAVAQRNKISFFCRCLELALEYHKDFDNQPHA